MERFHAKAFPLQPVAKKSPSSFIGLPLARARLMLVSLKAGLGPITRSCTSASTGRTPL